VLPAPVDPAASASPIVADIPPAATPDGAALPHPHPAAGPEDRQTVERP
jgi:hypothetical protein